MYGPADCEFLLLQYWLSKMGSSDCFSGTLYCRKKYLKVLVTVAGPVVFTCLSLLDLLSSMMMKKCIEEEDTISVCNRLKMMTNYVIAVLCNAVHAKKGKKIVLYVSARCFSPA